MDATRLLIGTACLIIVCAKVIPWLYSMIIFRRAVGKIPGPGYPIVGITYMLMKTELEDLLSTLMRWSIQYSSGMFFGWVAHDPYVVVYSPKYLEVILRSTVNIDKSHMYEFFKPALSEGLLTSRGKKWFRDRKLTTPSFHFQILDQFVPIMYETVKATVSSIEKRLQEKPGEPVEMFKFSLECALETICETSMGISLHSQKDGARDYVKAIEVGMPIAYHRIFRPWLYFEWIFRRTRYGSEFKRCVDKINQFATEVIKKRLEIRERRANYIKEQKHADDILEKPRSATFLLDHLLDASEKMEIPLTLQEIMEQVNTFTLVGHDTSAVAISWALFCIGNHPECQEKLYNEIREKLGDSEGPPTQGQLSEMKYLDRVVKESLRLFPAAPIIGRKLADAIQLDDYVLPKGATVIISPYITQRHPDNWSNPDAFDPDRFLPENVASRHPYAYIPFSAGARNCIGQKYALIELKLVLTGIVSKWRVDSLDRMDQARMVPAFVLRPANGLYLRFTDRKASVAT